MSEWTTVPIGSLAEGIYDGPHATPKRIDKGPIFLGISSLVGGRLDLSKSDHVSENDFAKWTRRVAPQSNDLVFSYETRLGEAALIPEGLRCCLGRRMALLRPDRSQVDPKFLLYAFLGPTFQNTIRSRTVQGSTVDRILLTEFPDFPITLPRGIDEQRRIAAVLGALDDRIEVNRRMNRTLEAMAQALFRSRFVGFDGRDDLVETEAGPIPSGWRWGKPADLIKFDPRTKLKKGTVARYLGMSDVPTEGFSIGELEDRPYTGGSKFVLGDTLLARITPSLENGKTALVDFLEPGEVGFGSTEFIVMRAREGTPREFVYCLARSLEFRQFAIKHMTGSSGRQRVSRDAFDHYGLPIPPQEQLVAFADAVLPMFDRISSNHRHNRTLAGLRDALLPKLVSGEIRVPEAEEAAEAVL